MTEKTQRILLWAIWLAACAFMGRQLVINVRTVGWFDDGLSVINQP
jgi:hypothetical protein